MNPTRIFFASDIHGSDAAFRKFVNAARFYGADALVFGGDLTGKGLVPIVRQDGGAHVAEFQGSAHRLDEADSLLAMKRRIADAGLYWMVMDPDEYTWLEENHDALVSLFRRLATERLRDWMEFADDRLRTTPVRCYLTGGNDDDPDVLSVLESSATDHLVPCEDRVVELDADHTMITVGYSTPTPWDTPREATEDDIGGAIEASMDRVPDPSRCVFNIHVPPLGSGLDLCIKVNTGTDPPSPVLAGGRPQYTRGGSQAVVDAVRRYQPLVGLHGHIHESPGQIRYGRTRCFNPGSEYGQGVLRGMILAIREGKLVGYQHTSG